VSTTVRSDPRFMTIDTEKSQDVEGRGRARDFSSSSDKYT
jgi:hypothetical protein